MTECRSIEDREQPYQRSAESTLVRDRLHQRNLRERDPDKCVDQQTVLGYLEKYQKEPVGHVIHLEGWE